MSYAITQTCCGDASCVSVCPVNCIHPAPGEPDFGTTETLYIDPRTCIDCGACTDACPVDAIVPVDLLGPADAVHAEFAERYYAARSRERGEEQGWSEPDFPLPPPAGSGDLRIAVVGTGPAAHYTAQALLRRTGAEVTMLDRLPVPGGLVRFGVAPDHPSTKGIGDSFAELHRHPRLRMHLNVDIGRDVTHAELAAHHDAVVYAVGADSPRPLGIPGEGMPGTASAMTFVAWYNGHPEVSSAGVDLASAERAVVIGNGNVAVDLARVLVSDPALLARTDIADRALPALRDSTVREVVLLGRRGPADAAYTRPELHALKHLPGVRLVIDDRPGVREAIAADAETAALLGDVPVERVDWAAPPPPGRRIVLRFRTSPVELTGNGRVEALRVSGPAGGPSPETIRTELVLSAIGHRGTPVAGLPFDDVTGTVPHERGRVVDPATGEPVAGVYVVGWTKRGPSGGIGANRRCAQETVDALLADAVDRRLPQPTGSRREFARLVRRRRPDSVGRRGAEAIDRAERENGRRTGRPRVKLATTAELLATARRFAGS
ncbi:FAD-dependent oxidoreductase [Streptomyces sp. NBC_01803]|uniref:FAD-dependent oxidoreductase n=1 Tax=Streptomyces sp. NBC_01803 TaxID=2975946 RepID=UPI002DDA28E5|nr:FAD-dependent oxidoreductase [Streptomyces sp. NBC_01803]WSA47410.1 FAD-dependent oxidoreductase [Streptomyces sp. NBC_01803]